MISGGCSIMGSGDSGRERAKIKMSEEMSDIFEGNWFGGISFVGSAFVSGKYGARIEELRVLIIEFVWTVCCFEKRVQVLIFLFLCFFG